MSLWVFRRICKSTKNPLSFSCNINRNGPALPRDGSMEATTTGYEHRKLSPSSVRPSGPRQAAAPCRATGRFLTGHGRIRDGDLKSKDWVQGRMKVPIPDAQHMLSDPYYPPGAHLRFKPMLSGTCNRFLTAPRYHNVRHTHIEM